MENFLQRNFLTKYVLNTQLNIGGFKALLTIYKVLDCRIIGLLYFQSLSCFEFDKIIGICDIK